MRLVLVIHLAVAFAATISAGGGDEPLFYPQPHSIPERGDVLSYIVRIDRTRFQFLPPPDWQATYLPEKTQIVLSPRNQAATITIQFSPWPKGTAAPPLKELREQASPLLADAQIREEFRAFTSNSEGCGFVLGTSNSTGLSLIYRVTFFVIEKQMIRFTLSAPESRAAEFQFAYQNLVTSFHALGKDLAPRSGSGSQP